MNILLLPSQRYQDSRHLLQNPKGPRSVMGFSNCEQRFTGSNYFDVDSPLLKLKFIKKNTLLQQEVNLQQNSLDSEPNYTWSFFFTWIIPNEHPWQILCVHVLLCTKSLTLTTRLALKELLSITFQ